LEAFSLWPSGTFWLGPQSLDTKGPRFPEGRNPHPTRGANWGKGELLGGPFLPWLEVSPISPFPEESRLGTQGGSEIYKPKTEQLGGVGQALKKKTILEKILQFPRRTGKKKRQPYWKKKNLERKRTDSLFMTMRKGGGTKKRKFFQPKEEEIEWGGGKGESQKQHLYPLGFLIAQSNAWGGGYSKVVSLRRKYSVKLASRGGASLGGGEGIGGGLSSKNQ